MRACRIASHWRCCLCACGFCGHAICASPREHTSGHETANVPLNLASRSTRQASRTYRNPNSTHTHDSHERACRNTKAAEFQRQGTKASTIIFLRGHVGSLRRTRANPVFGLVHARTAGRPASYASRRHAQATLGSRSDRAGSCLLNAPASIRALAPSSRWQTLCVPPTIAPPRRAAHQNISIPTARP